MKRLVLCLALVGLLGAAGQASALIGTIDDVPAATLLLPYFEVDLTANGVTTLFAIGNASATAILTHVTVWSDQSVPVLDFDIYLTGFDIQTVNLRDILVNGNLPVTASAGQDTAGDTISPHGLISQDINFASCTGILPYTNPAVSTGFRAHLQAWLRGAQSPATGNCAGANIGGRSAATTTNTIMRGYVTIDTVNACNLLFPGQLATGYDAFLTDQNVLFGDYFYVNPGQNFAQGETLVHIEACRPPGSGVGTNPPQNLAECPFVPGDHTFYGRYAAATAIDQREPLGTTYAARYVNGGGFDGGTDFLVWREGDSSDDAYACNLAGPSSWYPLPATQIVLFDEEENPVQQEDCPSGDPTCEQEIGIPNEAQRVDVAGDLLSPFDFGWAFLNLQHLEIAPIYGDDDAQAWVTVVMDAEGRFSVGFDAIQLDNANNPNTTVLPVDGAINGLE